MHRDIENHHAPIRSLRQPKDVSYTHGSSMVRIPDASYTLVQALNWLLQLRRLLASACTEQLRLLQHLTLVQIPHANRLLLAIYVVTPDDRMFLGPWGDSDLDCRIAFSELCEVVLEEGVHAFGAAGPVAVVKIDALALEEKGAYTILKKKTVSIGGFVKCVRQYIFHAAVQQTPERLACPFEMALTAVTGILAGS